MVDLPIKNGGSVHSFLYVYQRVSFYCPSWFGSFNPGAVRNSASYRHRLARWKSKPMLPSRHHRLWWVVAWAPPIFKKVKQQRSRMTFNYSRCWRWRDFTNPSDKDRENQLPNLARRSARSWASTFRCSPGLNAPRWKSAGQATGNMGLVGRLSKNLMRYPLVN